MLSGAAHEGLFVEGVVVPRSLEETSNWEARPYRLGLYSMTSEPIEHLTKKEQRNGQEIEITNQLAHTLMLKVPLQVCEMKGTELWAILRN